MPGYFSEIDYFGVDADEFIEVAVPTGTDVSGYTVRLYDASGSNIYTFSLGSVQATIAGHDVYVIDNSNPSFDSSGDPTGVMYPDDALALVDGGGTVQQFVSWEGNTVTATSGPASGMTSTNAGSAMAAGQSLQSDNGGSSYFTQTSTNKGTIPACFSRGTMIETPNGARRIETLKVGGRVTCVTGGTSVIRHVYRHTQTYSPDHPSPPVRFRVGCFAPDVPNRDLIVSGNHRLAVGVAEQIPQVAPALVPALAMANLRGVHVMRARRKVQWWHLICDTHVLISANNVVSESMLLGNMMFHAFTQSERRALQSALGPVHKRFGGQSPALPCMGGAAARRHLGRTLH